MISKILDLVINIFCPNYLDKKRDEWEKKIEADNARGVSPVVQLRNGVEKAVLDQLTAEQLIKLKDYAIEKLEDYKKK